MKITKFQKWVLRWICRKIVIQSYHHENNIKEYYQIMRDSAREQFTEDNDVTLNDFLQECHESTIGIDRH